MALTLDDLNEAIGGFYPSDIDFDRVEGGSGATNTVTGTTRIGENNTDTTSAKPLECVCKKTCDGKTCDITKKKTCIDDNKIIETLKQYHKSLFDKKNTDIIYVIIADLIEHHKVETESCLLLHPDFISFAESEGLSKPQIQGYVEQYFLPKGPRDMVNGQWPWLSNNDIDTVLHRLSICYPDFQNIGFQMIDFKEHGTLYNYDFDSHIKEGKRQFGVVINTDVSSGSGIHWFCLFFFFNSPDEINIEFFNSSGRGPVNEVQELIDMLSKKYKAKVFINRTSHQKKDSECGVYSLFYIWARLKHISVDKLFNHRIKDEQMEEFRKYLFRKC